jgi:hypothetical protein
MHIDILGAESLGVRGLLCVVETQHRRIVIDPDLALGHQRDGLPPHPAQMAVGEQVRWRIAATLESATDMDRSSHGTGSGVGSENWELGLFTEPGSLSENGYIESFNLGSPLALPGAF